MILFELENSGPSYLVKHYTGKKINDEESYFENKNYNLFILSKFNINIKKIKDEFEKVNEEKSSKIFNQSVELTPHKFNSLLNTEDALKYMEEKIEKNVTKINNIFNSSISSTKERRKTIDNNNNKISKTFPSKKINKKEEKYLNNTNNKNNNNNNINNKNDIDNKRYRQLKIPQKPTGLVGLSNIGATCYMNATLQSFSAVEFLRNELLIPEFYQKLENNKESEMRLTFALAEVFKNLWDNSDRKDYQPEYFKNVISDMKPLFKGITANDPNDLILFMLDTMHSELKCKDYNIIVDTNFIPNKHNFEEVYKYFSNYSLSKNKSIIFDIFFGCATTVTCCMDSKCRIQTYNFQVNNIIFFPLEEVRKFKNKNNETPVTIYDYFDFNQRYEIYKSFFCSGCNNNNTTVISFSKYLFAPKVLIINLNRGKGIQFNVKFNFEEYIDIKNYVYGKDSPHNYELIAVICHYGESGTGGHFIAFCKHFVINEYKWYKFNDSFVTECNFNEVQTSGMP